MKGLRILGLVLLASNCAAANMALRLTGDPESYFEVPDDCSLDADLDSAFTVEAWVNPEINFGENMVVNKEDVYEIAVKDGTFQTAVQPSGQGWEWWNSLAEVPTDEWTHIAITWDGEKIRTFVDGEFLESFDKPGVANDSPDTLKVGRRTRGGDTHSIYTGLIDEVRISRVVRYTEDGFDVLNTPFTPDADTVALYHFDEEVNGVVRDASELGNDGVLLNDAELEEDDFLLPEEIVQNFVRGDANADDTANIADAIFVLDYLFAGGPTPSCLKSADSDDSGQVDLTDPVNLLNYLFIGGPEPSVPFPACGIDPSEDALTCESHKACP